MARIYLDYNATSPLHPHVLARQFAVSRDVFGNPSSVHAFGQQAKAVVDEARRHVAALLHAEASEIVFTSGGTEADNFALRGALEAAEPTGRRHVVTTAIEHEAVLRTVTALERRGWQATVVRVGPSGIVAPEAIAAALTPQTAIVSVMHANNEVGTLQPLAEIAPLVHAAGALLHTDAVQTTGKWRVDVGALNVDLLSLSAHKFGGPKGVGALYVRKGTRLLPIQTGGKHERNRRAGTENVPGIAGLGEAARLASDAMNDTMPRVAALRDALEASILAAIDGTAVNGQRDARVPNTTNISFDRVEAESLLIALDLEGVAVSTGSACSSGALEPSHVLRAMGLPAHRTQNSIRFSLGPDTTADEIDTVLRLIPPVVEKLRHVSKSAQVRR